MGSEKKSAAEMQLEARAAQYASRVMQSIGEAIEKSGHGALNPGQLFAVRRAVMAQSAGFIAVVKLEAAALFQAEVTKMKAELPKES